MTLAAIPFTAAAIPASRPALKARSCAECGETFIPNSYQQQFCSPAHKTAFQNRAAVEGRAILALAKAWRAGRNVKGSGEDAEKRKAVASRALSEMCAILDSFMADDAAAGRPNPLEYAGRLLANGSRFIDRQRKGR